MGRRGSAWTLSLLLACAPDLARAEEDFDEPEPRPEPASQRSFADRPFNIMPMVGFGTLVGFFGLTAGYSVHHNVELGAGIGLNASGAMGGPYLRVRPLAVSRRKSRTLHAVAVDLGLSAGGSSFEDVYLGEETFLPSPEYHSDLALFLQTEVSWQMVKRDGFSMRAGTGWATLLNPGNVQCEGSSCGEPPRLFPVFLFQVGTSF